MMRLGSCCAGIGGIDAGFARAGWEVAWQIEIDPCRRAILAEHWPGIPRFDDLLKMDGSILDYVDCLAIGTPGRETSAGQAVFRGFLSLARTLAPPLILAELPPAGNGRFDVKEKVWSYDDFAALGYMTTPIDTNCGRRETGWLLGHRDKVDPFPSGRAVAFSIRPRDDDFTHEWFGSVRVTEDARRLFVREATPIPCAQAIADALLRTRTSR